MFKLIFGKLLDLSPEEHPSHSPEEAFSSPSSSKQSGSSNHPAKWLSWHMYHMLTRIKAQCEKFQLLYIIPNIVINTSSLLMIKNFLWHPSENRSTYLAKLGVSEDLYDIRIPPKFVTFFLSWRQVTAHEAQTRLVQRHAHWNTPLQLRSNSIYIIKLNLSPRQRSETG